MNCLGGEAYLGPAKPVQGTFAPCAHPMSIILGRLGFNPMTEVVVVVVVVEVVCVGAGCVWQSQAQPHAPTDSSTSAILAALGRITRPSLLSMREIWLP